MSPVAPRPAPGTVRGGVGIAVGALLLLTGAASARSSSWTLWLPPTDIHVACGATPVGIGWPYDVENGRGLPLVTGRVDLQQLTGFLTVRYSTAGRSVSYTIGGPGVPIDGSDVCAAVEV